MGNPFQSAPLFSTEKDIVAAIIQNIETTFDIGHLLRGMVCFNCQLSLASQNCALFGLSLLPWPAPDVKAGKHVDPHPRLGSDSRKVWASAPSTKYPTNIFLSSRFAS